MIKINKNKKSIVHYILNIDKFKHAKIIVTFLYKNFYVCFTNFVIVVFEHVDLMPSEDGQLTETCKGNKYLQIQSHWTVLTIIL
jgi:hypothetical protein